VVTEVVAEETKTRGGFSATLGALLAGATCGFGAALALLDADCCDCVLQPVANEIETKSAPSIHVLIEVS
jgi:hypothetical protein